MYLFRQTSFRPVILYVEEHLVLVCLLEQLVVEVLATVGIEAQNVSCVQVGAHGIANRIVSNNVSVLKSTDPEVLREDLKAMVMLLKVDYRFSVDRLHVEGLDY